MEIYRWLSVTWAVDGNIQLAGCELGSGDIYIYI